METCAELGPERCSFSIMKPTPPAACSPVEYAHYCAKGTWLRLADGAHWPSPWTELAYVLRNGRPTLQQLREAASYVETYQRIVLNPSVTLGQVREARRMAAASDAAFRVSPSGDDPDDACALLLLLPSECACTS